MSDQDFENPANWIHEWESDDDEDSLGANYLADDCTVHCGLCDTHVNDDGLCPHCDSGEIERRRYGAAGQDLDDREDFDP